MTHALKQVKVSRDDERWEAEVRAEIPAEMLATYRVEALRAIKKTAKIDGFREGHAPEDRIVQVYGEAAILREAVEHAIQHELPELFASEKLLIIESPKVSTDVPEAGKSLVFTARAALAPRVELPDYKNIADKHNAAKEEISVSDDEHLEAMAHLQRERARIEKIEAGTEPQKAAEESKAMKPEELPALDDAFVQSLGYESAEKFSAALRENIQTEKEMWAREKKRAAILDDLVKDSTINYPVALREYELDDMEARMKDDLSRMGANLEGYLAQAKKTREQLRSEWKDAADKRAKVRLILSKIAQQEKLGPEEKDVEHELQHAKEHYPQASSDSLRSHIVHMMRNELTLRFLEGNPPAGGEPFSHKH